MRSFGRIFTVLSLAALVLFVLPALVQCADAEQALPSPESNPASILQLVADVPAEMVGAPQTEPAWRSNETGRLIIQSRLTAVPVVSDANGCPLGSRSWVRAVWAANPPESIPGS